VLDIGPPCEAPLFTAGLPVEVLGVLDPGDISAALTTAKFGFLNYPAPFLCKSGVAAAFFAHGLLVVNLSNDDREAADPVEGREYIRPPQIAACFDFGEISAAGYRWYMGHRLSVTAEIVKGLI
jgi:hypothetical protein